MGHHLVIISMTIIIMRWVKQWWYYHFFLWNGGTIFDGFWWFIAPSYDFGDGLIMNLMNCPLTMIDLYMAFHIYEHLYMICVWVWVCMYMLYIYYGNTCLCSGLTRAYRNCTSLHAWRIWNCTWQSWPSSMHSRWWCWVAVTGCNHCTRRSQARTRRLCKGFLARNREHGAVLCLQSPFLQTRTYMKSSATPCRFIWQPGRSTRGHTYMHARLFHLFSLSSLSRMHGAAATKGSAGWEQTQLPASTNLNATVPLRVWVGRSANKWVARWRQRWRLRRGKLQDALALDTLRTRAGQVGGFAAPFLGPWAGAHFLGARF